MGKIEELESRKFDDIYNLKDYNCKTGTIDIFNRNGFKSIWQIRELIENNQDQLLSNVKYAGRKRIEELELAVASYPEFPDWFVAPESLINEENNEIDPETDPDNVFINCQDQKEGTGMQQITEMELRDLLLNCIFDIFEDDVPIGYIVNQDLTMVSGSMDIITNKKVVYIRKEFIEPLFSELTENYEIIGNKKIDHSRYLNIALDYSNAVNKYTNKAGHVFNYSKRRFSQENYIEIYIPKAEEEINRRFSYPKPTEEVYRIMAENQHESGSKAAPVEEKESISVKEKKSSYLVIPLKCGSYFDQYIYQFEIACIDKFNFDISSKHSDSVCMYIFDQNDITKGKLIVDAKYDNCKESIKNQIIAFLQG